jgi:protein-disulfide isomerase
MVTAQSVARRENHAGTYGRIESGRRRCWLHDPQTVLRIMSSRARQKTAAREARLAAEADARRRARRRRRLVRLAVIASLALVVVAAAAVVGPGEDEPATSTAPSRLFDGIPQNGISLGSARAPAVLTEFADLQCPFCAAYARDVLPAVVDRYVRTGRLRLELQVLTFLGEDSVRSGAMAAAAARQNRLWSFTDAFYHRQGAENSGYATDDFLRTVGAATPGLDVDRAFGDRERPEAQKTLTAAEQAASALVADHTPAFYVRSGDGPARPVEPAALTAEAFTTALDDALASR